MIISRIDIDGFKNLKCVQLVPDEKLNIIIGENAQGKTNLIEAIWICSGCKSFRNTKDKDMIAFTKERAAIDLSFKDFQREQKIQIRMKKDNFREKAIAQNGVRIKTMSKLFGGLKCVIFTPEDLELSKGSPENRRSYLDLCISQIKRGYKKVIDDYDNLISQRNSLLKNISYGISKPAELDVWDEQIARLGSYISMLRFNYTKKLNCFAKKLYDKISSGNEVLELSYSSTVFDSLEEQTDFNGEMARQYLSLLKKVRNDDIRTGFSQKGVHRDELVTRIDGLSAREFGSQGQQRSVSLILKLSQAYILFEETRDSPIILLDDVLSELDKKRQDFVLSQIEKMQVFITCCNNESFEKIGIGKLFEVSKGCVKEKPRR